MMSALSNAVTRFFTAEDAMLQAIRKDDVKAVSKLLAQRADVNARYVGYTPLATSLIREKREIALLLLEHGANPNTYVCVREDVDANEKMVQSAVTRGLRSEIRLLGFYGATAEGVKFEENENLRELLLATFHKYKQRRELEVQISAATSSKEKANLSVQLAELWAEQARAETDVVCKNHYEKKAEKYHQDARLFSHAIETELHPESQEDAEDSTPLLGLRQRRSGCN